MTQKAAILVADRSGSMKSILDNTVIGLNSYLEEIKQDADILFTMVRFDTISTDVVHRRVPVGEVPEISKNDIEPRGGTPLIDALAITIEQAKQDYKDDDRVVIVCMTDGHENASREFTLDALHALIKERSAVGWQFIFLGASIDAYADASKFGIHAGSTMSYDSHSVVANRKAYRGAAGQSMSYYSTGAEVNFSEQEKQDAGDKFIPGSGGGAKRGGEGTGGAKAPDKSLIDRVKL